MELDYELIGVDYCAGMISVREVARKHGCTEAAIRKMAKRYGWKRSLVEKVRERVKAKLLETDAAEARKRAPKTVKLPPEDEMVNGASDIGKDVILIHRAGARKCRTAAETLLEHLHEAMSQRAEIEQAIEEETAGDKNGKRRYAMLKAVSIPGHAAVVRDLSQALKNLIPLERQAFNLNDKPEDRYADLPRDEVERRLAELEKRR